MSVNQKVSYLMGAVIVIAMIASLASTFFNGLNNVTGAPSFFTTIAPLVVGGGLCMFIWRVFSTK